MVRCIVRPALLRTLTVVSHFTGGQGEAVRGHTEHSVTSVRSDGEGRLQQTFKQSPSLAIVRPSYRHEASKRMRSLQDEWLTMRNMLSKT